MTKSRRAHTCTCINQSWLGSFLPVFALSIRYLLVYYTHVFSCSSVTERFVPKCEGENDFRDLAATPAKYAAL